VKLKKIIYRVLPGNQTFLTFMNFLRALAVDTSEHHSTKFQNNWIFALRVL